MKQRSILLVLLLSVSFNIVSIAVIQAQRQAPLDWPFSDIGPGIMQDSYHDQSPVLETIFGMIGDLAGGYSLYAGNPIQDFTEYNLSTWIETRIPWILPVIEPDFSIVLVAAAVAILPLVIAAIIGRRSYGSTKTR